MKFDRELKKNYWLICILGLFLFLPGPAKATLYETSWCGQDLPQIDTCPAGNTEKSVSIPDSLVPDNYDPDKAKQYCGGALNLGCMKGKRTCPNQSCSSVTFCCASAGTGTASKCAAKASNGCGWKNPDPGKSYECMPNYDEPKCVSLYGGELSPSYSGCGLGTGCCIAPVCTAPAASGGTTPTAVKPPSEYKLTNPLGVTDISVIIGRIIKTFLGIVGGIALMVFVYGGVMWMTARGDQSQVKKGQEALTAAVIGLFIIIFSYTLAGNFVAFLTSEQTQIAQEENRGGAAPQTTAEAQQVQTIQSAQQQAAQQQAGQAGAAQAGQEAGVTTPPAGCDQLSGQAKLDCIGASGQSLYNTPSPQTGMPGGQKDCTGNPNCSQVGWITVCNEKVFDTGYGTYKNLNCMSPDACAAGSILSSNCEALKQTFSAGILKDFVSNNCTKIALGSFGNNCGSGGVCCRQK